MKRPTTILLLILPCICVAQNDQDMSDTDTQKMMQQMQQAQACMASIDQAELKKFEQQATQMDTSIKALCASGKRDEAQEEAVAFARDVSNNPSMRKMQECSKMMSSMPGMPAIPQSAAGEDNNRHICDQ
ncbi:MAG: hypothetical protein LJE75_12365 [Gammaproteobacteria bacterium]|jgi:hypothetical protein|nr:hypothetical protein [Gammaproteobacteria bacterium]